MSKDTIRLLHGNVTVDREQASGAAAALSYLCDADPKTFCEFITFCRGSEHTLSTFALQRLQAMAIVRMDGATVVEPFKDIALSCAIGNNPDNIKFRNPFVPE